MTEKQLAEIRARAENINEVQMISWCSKDMPALLNYIDDLKTEITKLSAVLREAIDEREKALIEDMGRICKFGVTLPAWYYTAKELIGGE